MAINGLFRIAMCIVSISTDALSNPEGGVVKEGDVRIESAGAVVNVITNSDKSIIHWDSFNIGAGEKTHIEQRMGSSSIVLNRVFDDKASQINGALESNGRVVIINKNGVMFEKGSNVDVGSLIVSTGDIKDQDFISGDMKFLGANGGEIKNEGRISTSEGGRVMFIAPKVVNNGSINGKDVALIASSGATLSIDGTTIEVEDGLGDLLALQMDEGEIVAQNGSVSFLSGKTTGDNISVIGIKGNIDVSGDEGGSVSVYAQGGNAVKGNIEANKRPEDIRSKVVVKGKIKGVGEKKSGGQVEVLGDVVEIASGAIVDVSGASGGGSVKIGGQYLGGGSTPSAIAASMNEGSVVMANALDNGNGGRVILWSDGVTNFKGNIYAKGGRVAGDGGFVETSGKKLLKIGGIADTSAPNGKTGVHLLDPANIEVVGNFDPDTTWNNFSNKVLAWIDSDYLPNISLEYTTLSATLMGANNFGDTFITVNRNALHFNNNERILVPGSIVSIGVAHAPHTADASPTDIYIVDHIENTGGSSARIHFESPLTQTYTVGTNTYVAKVTQVVDRKGIHTAISNYNNVYWIDGRYTINGKNALYYGSLDFSMTDSIKEMINVFQGSAFSYNVGSNPFPPYFGISIGSADGVAVNAGDWDITDFILNGEPAVIDTSVYDPIASKNYTTANVPYDSSALNIARTRILSNPYSKDISLQGAYTYDMLLLSDAADSKDGQMLEQYYSALYNKQLKPPGTGVTEVEKATASDGYDTWSTRYIERLLGSSNVILNASNDLDLNLMGDTISLTSGNSLSFTASNNINIVSFGGINSNGGNISLSAGSVINHNANLVLTNTSGIISLYGDVSLGHDMEVQLGQSGTFISSGNINGGYNLTIDSTSAGSGTSITLPNIGTGIDLNNINIKADTITIDNIKSATDVSIESYNSISVPSIEANTISVVTTGPVSDISMDTGKVIRANSVSSSVTLLMVAQRNFHNNSGGNNVITNGGGIFNIYSTSPDDNTMGMTVSGKNVYSCTYLGSCPSFSVTDGISKMLYSYTPTVNVIPNTTNIVYGDAAPNLNGASVSYDGYPSVIDEGIDSPTGTVNWSTPYVAGNDVGSYDINYVSGSKVSSIGVSFSYPSPSTTSVVVAPRVLTPSLIGSATKVYNGTTAATLDGSNWSVSNKYGSDDVYVANTSGVYANKNAGTGKNISVSTLTLGGVKSGNYSLSTSSINANIGTITAKGISITGVNAQNKVYDGLLSAALTGGSLTGIEGADVVTISSGTAVFANKNVGTAKAVTASGYSIGGADVANYTLLAQPSGLSANITAKGISITGVSAQNKVYDGLLSAALTGGSLTGIEGADAVTISSGTAVFANKNVGTAKTVTASGYSIGGADVANYTLLAQPSGLSANITAKGISITGVSAQNKVYDGLLSAALTGGSLTGIEGADAVTISSGTAVFANKNVGTAKTVTASGYSIGGADVANYTLLAQPSGLSADITAKGLTVTAQNKSKQITTSDPALTYSYTGLAAGDTTASFTGLLDRDLGESLGTYQINIGTLSATGNYLINTFNTGVFTITPQNVPIIVPSNPTSNSDVIREQIASASSIITGNYNIQSNGATHYNEWSYIKTHQELLSHYREIRKNSYFSLRDREKERNEDEISFFFGIKKKK